VITKAEAEVATARTTTASVNENRLSEASVDAIRVGCVRAVLYCSLIIHRQLDIRDSMLT
jgi:hypothetical protein